MPREPGNKGQDFDVVEHVHLHEASPLTRHTHADGSLDHGHMAQAICGAEECKGLEMHNMHPARKRNPEPISGEDGKQYNNPRVIHF